MAVAGCQSPIPKGYDLGRCRLDSDVVGTPGQPKPNGSLRVVTANMWGIPYWSRDVDARFHEMARRLSTDTSVDIVGLQEMWDEDARQKFLRLVAEQFPHRIDFHGEHRRSGLVLISRRPFVGQPVFVPFERTGKWWKPWTGEYWGGKGVGGVRARVADRDLWVFVTHLHACYDGSAVDCEEDDEYAPYRLDQLATVRSTVNRLAGNEPALVLGDFNFTARSRYYRLLQEVGADSLGFDPAWRLVGESDAPPSRIDFIWLRGGRDRSLVEAQPAAPAFIEPVVLGDGRSVGISDHCPIAATIAIDPGPSVGVAEGHTGGLDGQKESEASQDGRQKTGGA